MFIWLSLYLKFDIVGVGNLGSVRKALTLFSNRTYRGFNLSNNVADVTLENNLSRVVTAVSHAFTSSTSRALTVRFQQCFFYLLCHKIQSTQVFLHRSTFSANILDCVFMITCSS